MTEVKDTTISLFKLEAELAKKIQKFSHSLFNTPTDSFRFNLTANEKYVKPNFTEIEGKFKDKLLPKIFLITAAGATG